MAADADPQLPPGKGLETVKKICSACHAAELVLEQHGDRVKWQQLVDSMIDRGATPTDSETKEIVDYLAANFPAEGAAAAPPAGDTPTAAPVGAPPPPAP